MLHENPTNTHIRPRPARLLLLCGLLSCGMINSAAAEVRSKVRCDITQIALEDCTNLVRADFDNGRHTWSFSVAGPLAFAEKMETYLVEPAEIYILDYATFSEDNSRMVNVKDAWFLFEATGDESLNQKPHIYGFRRREAAVEAQKDLGGELQRWDEIWATVFRLAEEWDRQKDHKYGSLRKGRRS